MNEVIAAIIGATVSIFLVAINNITAKKDRDVREIFNRLNRLEKEVASMNSNKNWRNR